MMAVAWPGASFPPPGVLLSISSDNFSSTCLICSAKQSSQNQHSQRCQAARHGQWAPASQRGTAVLTWYSSHLQGCLASRPSLLDKDRAAGQADLNFSWCVAEGQSSFQLDTTRSDTFLNCWTRCRKQCESAGRPRQLCHRTGSTSG